MVLISWSSTICYFFIILYHIGYINKVKKNKKINLKTLDANDSLLATSQITASANKGEFRFGPIRAYVYLLAVSQSKYPDLLYFRLRYDFYTRIPLYK